MKRRDFLNIWGTAGALGALAPAALRAASQPGAQAQPAALTAERFMRLLNSRFRIYTDERLFRDAELVAVELERGNRQGLEQFTLLLEGSADAPPLAAASYPVMHRDLGAFALYLEPMDRPGSYCAHFGLLS